MKLFIFFAVIIGSAMAQRPMYAGSAPIGRPDLGSRFRDPNASSTPEAPNLSNRVGEDGSTIRTPVDALGDQKLVDRLNEWPREHRPFWLLNSEAIEASRNQNVNQQLQQRQQQQNLETRGNFDNFEDDDDGFNAGGGNQGALPIRPTNHRSSFLSPIN